MLMATSSCSLENMAVTTQLGDQYLRYLPLRKAAQKGDWKSAERFIVRDREAITARITKRWETALHVAVAAAAGAARKKANYFVENVVNLMSTRELKLVDINGNTALHIAARVGNTKAALKLSKKCPDLLYIRNDRQRLPVHLAARAAYKDTLLYLLHVTKEDHPLCKPFERQSGVQLLVHLIYSEFYDVAFDLVRQYPNLATNKLDSGLYALRVVAGKASAFPSGSNLNFWQRLIYSCVPVKLESYTGPQNRVDSENPHVIIVQSYNCARFLKEIFIFASQKLQAMLWKVIELLVPHIKHIQKKKLDHCHVLQLVKLLCRKIRSLNDEDSNLFIVEPLLKAATSGIHEIVEEILDLFPDVVWATDQDDRQTIHLAVIHHHIKIISFMDQNYENITEVLDPFENNILHLAGRLAPPTTLNLVSGAALQMQQDLQWFKEVENIVHPSYREMKNKFHQTPWEVFINAHKELVLKGEKWMKDTANSCTIVAALIVTIVFAAAITVPGGNNGTSGLPIFSEKKAFITFAVSDAISLFTSTTSLLMFLSILTSRYAERDFFYALPNRLIIGLVTLFVSITTMMIAFSSTLYVVFGHNKAWILVPVIALASLPITSFMFLQFPLLLDLISSSCLPYNFYKIRK